MSDESRIFFEDLEEGQVFVAGPIEVTAAAIKTFAREYDPQPQHMDEGSASATQFEGLAASGWHTAAITMRLAYDAVVYRFAESMGLGTDKMRWLRPVRPGDRLSIRIIVGALRRSHSKPGFGIVRHTIETLDSAGTPVLSMEASCLLRVKNT